MEVSWKAPSADLSLSKNDIHLWRADLNLADRSIQKFYQILSTAERMKAERFYFERDRRRYTIRVGILRMILSLYLCVNPKELRFVNGKHGKPMLDEVFVHKSIHFNMSHSEDLALYGFTLELEIGVDIECIRDVPKMDKIAQHFFSIKENDDFRLLSKIDKNNAFFNCWTRKEAFVKAIGAGLYQPLNKFEVTLKPGEPAKLLSIGGDSKKASKWYIHDFKPAPGFTAAFAVKGHEWKLHFWQWLN